MKNPDDVVTFKQMKDEIADHFSNLNAHKYKPEDIRRGTALFEAIDFYCERILDSNYTLEPSLDDDGLIKEFDIVEV
jgi:hypothetical protein